MIALFDYTGAFRCETGKPIKPSVYGKLGIAATVGACTEVGLGQYLYNLKNLVSMGYSLKDSLKRCSAFAGAGAMLPTAILLDVSSFLVEKRVKDCFASLEQGNFPLKREIGYLKLPAEFLIPAAVNTLILQPTEVVTVARSFDREMSIHEIFKRTPISAGWKPLFVREFAYAALTLKSHAAFTKGFKEIADRPPKPAETVGFIATFMGGLGAATFKPDFLSTLAKGAAFAKKEAVNLPLIRRLRVLRVIVCATSLAIVTPVVNEKLSD
jgi:hypothetical protein